MTIEKLSSYFKGFAWKRLSAVEADPEKSHQHEFNGDTGLLDLFGKAGKEKKRIDAQFVYLGESEEVTIRNISGFLTWYDARARNSTGANRSEHRLYFPENLVSEAAKADDLLIIGKRNETTAIVIIAKAGSTYEKQIAWLFGIEIAQKNKFSMRKVTGKENTDLDYVSRLILEELGIEIVSRADDFLEIMLKRFGNDFPSTPIFSRFARETAEHFDCRNSPDEALLGWMEQEEKLFRTFEYQLVSERLKKGFGTDVDSFVSYSLHVHNRRKSRSGRALENHLEHIFLENDVRFTKYGVTENNSKPDFLFPGVKEYRDQSFPEIRLSMLGVKTTCKDRWRQVLAEAARISRKHLFTMEPGISENQTNEMKAKELQLVIPSGLFKTYTASQQNQLLTLSQFISLVKDRQ